jgi:nucleoside-diphosphate-sugar epimerase
VPDVLLEDGEIVRSRVDLSALDGTEVLLTGASGLIGSHLLRVLSTGGGPLPRRVIAVSRSGVLPSGAVAGSNVDLVKGDLTDLAFLSALPEVDVTIHGAGYGQPGRFLQDPLATLALNTTATIELIRKTRVGGRFLFMSTSEVYSGLEKEEYREGDIGTTNTDHPRSGYIEAKRAGEAATVAARSMRGLDAASVRIALAYGPGVKTGDVRVLNEFIARGLADGVIRLRDPGDAMRTYCYVADAVEMILQVLLSGTEPIYNVGGISRTSVAGLAQIIGRIIDVPVVVPEQDAGAVGAPADVRLDLSRTLALTRKQEFVSLDEGLERTIKWFRGLP